MILHVNSIKYLTYKELSHFLDLKDIRWTSLESRPSVTDEAGENNKAPLLLIEQW